MQSTPLARCLGVAAILAATATAQVQYETNLGTGQGAGDDTIAAGLALGFNFAFPDGTIVSTIDVDSNGRILLPGGDTSDFSESVGELLSGTSSICPTWDDLNFNGTADDLYFNALPGKAVITWHDVAQIGSSVLFTVQAQLFPDGRIVLIYDPRVPNDDPIVGVSSGNGAADPGEVDISSNYASNGVPVIYEDFSNDFDLTGKAVQFIPDGNGGYVVVTTDLYAGIRAGRPGTIEHGLTFVPDGAGGYNVAIGAPFDTTFTSGTALTLADDGLTGALPLGFSFTFPGGTPTTDIEVDSNGRIILPGSDTSDYTESVAELLSDAASICPFWNDMNPTMGGMVWFHTGPGGASVTWDRVPQYQQTVPTTFQARLLPSGVVHFVYLDSSTYVQTDAIVGLSAGNGVTDPGEVDLSGPSASAGAPIVYEFFDVANSEVFDLVAPIAPPVLVATSVPVLGTSLDLDITSAPAGTLAHFYLLGLPVLQDLASFGIGLDGSLLLSDGLLFTTATAAGTPLSIPVPNDPNLTGVSIEVQGATVSPGYNPLGLAFTGSLTATIGQ